MFLDNRVNALIDVLRTGVSAQDEVQDALKVTDTHHFGNHGRTYAQNEPQFY